MNVYKNLSELPTFENSVVTIGSFDGVHFGHRKLIKRAKTLAQEVKGIDIVVTFHPHPRSIIYPKDRTLQVLTSLDEKLALFEEVGVSNVVVVPFTIEFSQQPPQEYVERFLIKSFHPTYLIVGYDHKFGLNRQGDINLLREYEKKGHFKIIEVKQQELDEITISSTKIRTAIYDGDIRIANQYLGGYYPLTGIVVKGDSIGEKIGFPTANIKISTKEKLIPNIGVYAVFVDIANTRYQGMLYIGSRPTIGSALAQSIEVNIFDFQGSLYNEEITVQFVETLRADEKFESLKALTDQLHIDRTNAVNVLSNESKLPLKPKCVIAILNYNGVDHLESYLATVLDSTDRDDVEVLLIDNASTDDSLSYVQEWHPEVKIIEFTTNHGYAGGYTLGLEKIEADYFALVNSDVLVDSNWLDPILSYMDEHKDVVSMQPKIKSLEAKNSFEYAGAAGGFVDLFFYPFCRGRVFDTVEEDNGQYNDIREVFWTSGAAMVVRADLFKKLGGFDKDYFAHMEEIDFCWRAKRAGHKCMIHGGTEVFHLGGGTLAYDSPRKTFLNFRNSIATIIKNESKRFFLLAVFVRLILDGIAGIKFLVEGKWQHTWAILQAHFSIYISIFDIIEKRMINRGLIAKAKIGKMNWAGRVRTSVVLEYFVFGSKTFNQITKK